MKYRDIIFFQDEAASPILEIFNEDPEKALEHMKEWDNGEGYESDEPMWGAADCHSYHDDYVISYNRNIGYIGLTHVTKD